MPFSFFQISNDHCQKFMEKPSFFIMDFEGSYEVLLCHKYFWSTYLWQWNDGPFKFFEICKEMHFVSLFFSKWKKSLKVINKHHILIDKQLQCTYFPIPYDQCSSHKETSQLICCGNQLTGFYMRGILVVKRLIEYNQRNTFLQKSCRKLGRETLLELYKSFLEWPWSIPWRL